ncbi:hypothetical protein BDV93DRAFT_514767 [Ceratobasidium sp. AG-I]|nr:hypothetical protein BDV93DRAFT_514767 [Ceratobasidium sp. AG-I]
MLQTEDWAPQEPSQPNPVSSGRVTTHSKGRHAPANVVDDPTSDAQSSHTKDSPIKEVTPWKRIQELSMWPLPAPTAFDSGWAPKLYLLVFENPTIFTGPGYLIEIEDYRSNSIEPEDGIIDQVRPSSSEPIDTSPIDMCTSLSRHPFKAAVPPFRPSSSKSGCIASHNVESDRMPRNNPVDRGGASSMPEAEPTERSTNALENSAVQPTASASGKSTSNVWFFRKDVGRAIPAIPALAHGNAWPNSVSSAGARAHTRELREFAGHPPCPHHCGSCPGMRAFPRAGGAAQ